MARTTGAVERERESYTLENRSEALLGKHKNKKRDKKRKDMMYLCNFGLNRII